MLPEILKALLQNLAESGQGVPAEHIKLRVSALALLPYSLVANLGALPRIEGSISSDKASAKLLRSAATFVLRNAQYSNLVPSGSQAQTARWEAGL